MLNRRFRVWKLFQTSSFDFAASDHIVSLSLTSTLEWKVIKLGWQIWRRQFSRPKTICLNIKNHHHHHHYYKTILFNKRNLNISYTKAFFWILPNNCKQCLGGWILFGFLFLFTFVSFAAAAGGYHDESHKMEGPTLVIMRPPPILVNFHKPLFLISMMIGFVVFLSSLINISNITN